MQTMSRTVILLKNIMIISRNALLITLAVCMLICMPAMSFSITLDEAIALAKENLPSFKAATLKVKSTEALHKATLGPYLPSLDASTSQKRFYTSVGDFSSRDYDLTLSYTLFDGGQRRANRNIAQLNLDTDREELRKNLIDLEYNVKVAFFSALARKEALEQRKIQLQDAQKDYEVAEGRRKFGVAKLSDVLQASVRLEQARYNLVQAEGDLRKANSDLNSLIGYSLDGLHNLQGTLDMDMKLPDRNKLSEAVLQRPEIKQAENLLKISENSKKLSASFFYPTVSADASYIKTEGSISRISFAEEKTLGVTAKWNLFELGKFFKLSSSEIERDVSLEKLNDIKRQMLLDVHKTYEDYITASNQFRVAQEQLKQAGQNYSQALGEYKVGKADILSLVQAESLLSIAREQIISSKLNLILSRSLLERAAGMRWPELQ